MTRLLVLGFVFLSLSVVATGQLGRSGSNKRVPKSMVVDDQGMWQWKSLQKSAKKDKDLDLRNGWKLQACPQCGTEKANKCVTCGGSGKLNLEGGNPKGSRCGVCRGKGEHKCSLCRGKGYVEACKFKSVDVRKASRALLEAAKDDIEKSEENLDNAGRGSTAQKKGDHFQKATKPAGKWLAGAKRQGPGLKKKIKGLAKLQQFRGFQVWVSLTIERHRRGLRAHFRKNLALIDLALSRHEHNEKTQKAIDIKKAIEAKKSIDAKKSKLP